VQQFALVNICKYAASNAGKCSHTTGRLEKLLGPFGVSKGEGLLQRDCMEKSLNVRGFVRASTDAQFSRRETKASTFTLPSWLHTGCTLAVQLAAWPSIDAQIDIRRRIVLPGRLMT